MQRPKFTCVMRVEDFKQYYWYKTELETICKAYRLPTYGTKYELETYIIRLLRGESASMIKPLRKNKRRGLSANLITPETNILASGFSLNAQARMFFCSYYGTEKFSFKKAMGIKMRDIEAKNDITATVQDLIIAYEQGSDLSDNHEEQTYQWNNFLKDFRNDDLSHQYDSPMKVAAVLWQKVRDSNQEKRYSHELLVSYEQAIRQYLKVRDSHEKYQVTDSNQ
ncbi:SAP domain-containing protein [uncultured Leuconostoc sp.]|uniref:SAP domain-containing protein n=1 Tax=uncultured Leuconostoc sp. TaxID=173262 RepID=UPI0025F60A6F|nr:SAP domain-containing protein [uncultured Leuconostoc sp.]